MTTNTNKILEKLVDKKVLVKIAKDLGLQCKPHITYTNDTDDYVMAAVYTAWSTGMFFRRTITRTETNGEIKVNLTALDRMQKRYGIMCGSRQAAIDITIALLRHECRHLLQYEDGTFIGRETDDFNFSEILEGHGSSFIERQANEYAISASRSSRMRALAVYMEIEQRQTNFSQYDASYVSEIRQAGLDMMREYNYTWYRAMETLAKVVTR